MGTPLWALPATSFTESRKLGNDSHVNQNGLTVVTVVYSHHRQNQAKSCQTFLATKHRRKNTFHTVDLL